MTSYGTGRQIRPEGKELLEVDNLLEMLSVAGLIF